MSRPNPPTTLTAVSASFLLVLSGILTLCFRSFQPEGAFLCCQPSNGVQFAISDESAEALIRISDSFLNDTAELLGSRYNQDFYQGIVRGGLERVFTGESISNPAKTESGAETFLALFGTDEIENDPVLSETLAFLKETESAPYADLPPAFVYCYDSGNPLNAAAIELTAADQKKEYAGLTLTSPIRNPGTFTLLFSFFSAIIPFFPQNSAFFPFCGSSLNRRFSAERFGRFFFQLGGVPQSAIICLKQIFTDPQISERKTVVLIR